MSKNIMTIQSFISVAPDLPPRSSILLRGDHGIGKSQLAHRVRAMLVATIDALKGEEFPVIDRRLSQVSEGDIIGLPSTDGNVTRFNPPDWYKDACNRPCFLFLDELNRATPEVMQAAFQIVLDGELNGWKLHPLTYVYSAVNASAAYNVNEIDPALLDRFWVVDLHPDVQDWLIWAREPNPSKACGYNVLPVVADFVMNNNKFLDPPKNYEPGSVQVSRRSWEKLSNALEHAKIDDKPLDARFYLISMGYIGTEPALHFVEFAKTQDNRFTGKDILNSYQKVRSKIHNKHADIANQAVEKLAEEVLKLNEVTDAQGKNVRAFMDDLGGELKLVLWTKVTAAGIDKLNLIKTLHAHLAPAVLGVFNVPMGEAGIGVVPNIPGAFKKKDQAAQK